MKKKSLILLMTAFFAALTVYGKKTSAEPSFTEQENMTGTWIIDTTIIKQTVDSVSTTKTYLAGDTAVSFVRRPVKIIIATDEIAFEYPDGTETRKYTVEGNNLLVDLPGRIGKYQYVLIDPHKIQLNYTVHYVIDGIYQIEEQYSFKGKAVINEK